MSRGKWVVAPKEMKTIQVVGRTVSGPERVLISFIARFGTTSLSLSTGKWLHVVRANALPDLR